MINQTRPARSRCPVQGKKPDWHMVQHFRFEELRGINLGTWGKRHVFAPRNLSPCFAPRLSYAALPFHMPRLYLVV